MHRLRVGIIGCGAVTEAYHLPACQQVREVELAWLVDTSETRARSLAKRFDVPRFATDYRQMLDRTDAVVLAVPNHLHRDIAVECLHRGIHVLCEKPLARSVTEGQEMVNAARSCNATLAVGLVRRAWPGALAMRSVLQAGVLGELTSFDVREGHGGTSVGWPAQSVYRFDRAESGGGCLIDQGPHLLDLLLWWIGDVADLESYEDDSWGGVEANARVRLALNHRGGRVSGIVEISTDRALRNTARIDGARGRVELVDVNTVRLSLHSSGSDLDVEALAHAVECGPDVEDCDPFVRQMEWFVAAVRGLDSPYVDGMKAMGSMAIIEECYRQRRLWFHPWDGDFCDPAVVEKLSAVTAAPCAVRAGAVVQESMLQEAKGR